MMHKATKSGWMVTAVLAGVLIGCGEGDKPSAATPETGDDAAVVADVSPEAAAQAAVQDMLTLAEAGQWGELIDQHYGEAHKFTSSANRDALAKRFADGWGGKLIPALRQAAGVTPTIDGDRAVFSVEGEPVYVLHREADGRWMFHL